ncbi:MAG: class I SAM-dependent methyltransferase [Candidatus Moraniibacteriota bacterium]
MNYNHYDNDRFWKSIILKIKKYKISGNILDIGCAFGFLLKRLPGNFDELHGIDISKYAVERAKKEIPSAKIQRVNINTDGLPYPDEYFDLVTALDVLEHTESIEKNLNKIVNKIKKGGYLIITVPVNDSWAGKIFRFFDKDTSHISVLSRKEIFKMLENSNLKILEKNYFLNSIFFKIKHIPVDIELLLQKD